MNQEKPVPQNGNAGEPPPLIDEKGEREILDMIQDMYKDPKMGQVVMSTLENPAVKQKMKEESDRQNRIERLLEQILEKIESISPEKKIKKKKKKKCGNHK